MGGEALAALVALALLAAPRGAEAQQERCLEAHVNLQRLRQKGELLSARREALGCAVDSCPSLVRADCGTWLGEIERDLPTVIVAASDGERRDVSEARLLVDGVEAAQRLDGKPMPLDPGPHTIRVEGERASAEARVVVQTGVKNRLVELTLAAPTSPPPRRSVPTAAWVSGGIALGALASFAAFALAGQLQYDRLRSGCSPSCSTSDTDHLKTKFLLADLSLATAAVASGVTVFLLWRASDQTSAAASAAPRPSLAGLGLGGSFLGYFPCRWPVGGG